jgi:hypothetical protein
VATTTSTEFTREEVGLALRNPGMPLEALRRPITPVGMHYVLIHTAAPSRTRARRSRARGRARGWRRRGCPSSSRASATCAPGARWSRVGRGPGPNAVSRVEFSADGGRTWQDARLEEPNGRHGWSAWPYDWDAGEAGDYELCVRATDAAGDAQPVDSDETWNQGGYGVNAVQRVPVRVS